MTIQPTPDYLLGIACGLAKAIHILDTRKAPSDDRRAIREAAGAVEEELIRFLCLCGAEDKSE